jgi:hypothetical protein
MNGVRAALLVFDQGFNDALEHVDVVGFLHSFAAGTLESVKSDDEATASLQHLLSCVPQPENSGIYCLLPAVEESDKDAKALVATCGFLESFVVFFSATSCALG